ncbi:MAG TPA: M48 family metalloprotease [bacterium]|nr:M48 family metalloprotease [bacterium]HQI48715.1 M48 family metalloprotease [bacterium]HQJ63696.1 M48 family metalloprotease [bacterium]
MKRYVSWVAILAALMLLGWLIACAVNPVTGKHQLMLMSESDEIALGQQSDAEVTATYGIYDDAALNTYVNTIGQKMGKLSHRPNLAYSFKVLDTDVVNAFAVPGGYVYVTRGILAYLNDEAELAGVIGHEIGHVAARHTVVSYSKQQLASLGLGLGSILSEKFRQYANIANFGVTMLFLKFSRDDERQADNLGVEYSSKASYDANCMATFFETLERMNEGSSSSGLPDWFSTHPNPANRITAVRAKTKEWQSKLTGTTFVVRRPEYLASIDGIVFGADPRQGYVEANTFYHPELKFQFAVPTGWRVNNTPAQVQMVSPNQDANLLFSLQSRATAAAVADTFVTQSQASVSRADAITINGFPTRRIQSRIISQSDTLGVLSWFIQKGSDCYIFHGVTTPKALSAWSNTFAGAVGQFKTLTDPKHINVSAKRLKIENGKPAATLSSLLTANGIASTELENFAVVNGMQLTDLVPPTAKYKIAK